MLDRGDRVRPTDAGWDLVRRGVSDIVCGHLNA